MPKSLQKPDALTAALQYTLVNEGGFSNDAADHGGATRFGITRAEASRWLKRPVSVAEMREFPMDTAKAIYEAWYWLPLGCDKIIDGGVATCMFDIGVVRGIGVPPKYAQLICNEHGLGLVLDGHIGPKSLAAINSLNPHTFIPAFAEKAAAGFRSIAARNPSQEVFLRGWLNRAKRLLTLMKP